MKKPSTASPAKGSLKRGPLDAPNSCAKRVKREQESDEEKSDEEKSDEEKSDEEKSDEDKADEDWKGGDSDADEPDDAAAADDKVRLILKFTVYANFHLRTCFFFITDHHRGHVLRAGPREDFRR